MPYSKLLFLFVLFNILSNGELGAQDSTNNSWLGWRGQSYGSVELISPPIKWGINNNIVWKSPIKGDGHSSPVSEGRFVYITSSSTDDSVRIVENIFTFLEIFLVIGLIYLTIKSNSINLKNNHLNIIYFGLSLSVLINCIIHFGTGQWIFQL